MSLIVLIPMFVVVFTASVWALGDPEPAKYIMALCIAILCVIAVSRQPEIIGLLGIPYQALAIAMLVSGLIWLFLQYRKPGGK